MSFVLFNHYLPIRFDVNAVEKTLVKRGLSSGSPVYILLETSDGRILSDAEMENVVDVYPAGSKPIKADSDRCLYVAEDPADHAKYASGWIKFRDVAVKGTDQNGTDAASASPNGMPVCRENIRYTVVFSTQSYPSSPEAHLDRTPELTLCSYRLSIVTEPPVVFYKDDGCENGRYINVVGEIHDAEGLIVPCVRRKDVMNARSASSLPAPSSEVAPPGRGGNRRSRRIAPKNEKETSATLDSIHQRLSGCPPICVDDIAVSLCYENGTVVDLSQQARLVSFDAITRVSPSTSFACSVPLPSAVTCSPSELSSSRTNSSSSPPTDLLAPCLSTGCDTLIHTHTGTTSSSSSCSFFAPGVPLYTGFRLRYRIMEVSRSHLNQSFYVRLYARVASPAVLSSSSSSSSSSSGSSFKLSPPKDPLFPVPDCPYQLTAPVRTSATRILSKPNKDRRREVEEEIRCTTLRHLAECSAREMGPHIVTDTKTTHFVPQSRVLPSASSYTGVRVNETTKNARKGSVSSTVSSVSSSGRPRSLDERYSGSVESSGRQSSSSLRTANIDVSALPPGLSSSSSTSVSLGKVPHGLDRATSQVLQWARGVKTCISEMEWQHIGFEIFHNGVVNTRHPLYRCPSCRVVRDLVHENFHRPECRISAALQSADGAIDHLKDVCCLVDPRASSGSSPVPVALHSPSATPSTPRSLSAASEISRRASLTGKTCATDAPPAKRQRRDHRDNNSVETDGNAKLDITLDLDDEDVTGGKGEREHASGASVNPTKSGQLSGQAMNFSRSPPMLDRPSSLASASGDDSSSSFPMPPLQRLPSLPRMGYGFEDEM